MSNDPGKPANKLRRSPSENVTLVSSIAIVGGVVALIVWLMITGADDPPILVTHADVTSVTQTDSGYQLPISVTNDGDRSAIEVVVEATLSGAGVNESVAFTITLLPSNEQDTGFVVFANDPREFTLEVGIRSFQEP